MSMMRLISSLASMLTRRPWLPAVLVALPFLVSMAAFAVLFGNQCCAHFRFMSELSDEVIVCIGLIQEQSAKVTVFTGGLLVLSPVVLLRYKRMRKVFALLVWGVCIFLVMIAVKSFIPFIIRFAVAEQIRTARVNLEEKAALEKQGRHWQRRPIVHYEQHRWCFHDMRYTIRKPIHAGSTYELWDEQSRPNQSARGEWDRLRLLQDVVRWHEDGKRLVVLTERGSWYFVEYESGELKELK